MKNPKWTYSEYRATLYKNKKIFAIVTPDLKNSIDKKKIKELLVILNK